MKAPSLKLYFVAILLWTIIMGSGIVLVLTSTTYQERGLRNLERQRQAVTVTPDRPSIDQKQALVLTAATPEVQALYEFFSEPERCVHPEVMRPCDTDWVTCVDDAWVVVYPINTACLRQPDERMALRFLVDNQSGAIRSRFPEVDYFRDPGFCQIAEDCLPDAGQTECVNFIHALTLVLATSVEPAKIVNMTCGCQNQRCAADVNRF